MRISGRAGWCVTFLEMNGVELLDIPDLEAADLMVNIVDGDWTLEQITDWLADRT
jgi:prophage maintenance system killer protein